MQKLEAECRTHIRVEQQMKIHIETLLQRLEESEKRHRIELTSLDSRMQELLRDKTRLEELLSIKNGEVQRVLNEQRDMAEARDKDRVVIKNQSEHIEVIKRELEEIKRRLTEGMMLQNHKVVSKKMFNNSNSPTETQNIKAKMKQELIEIYQKSLNNPTPSRSKKNPTLVRPPSVSNSNWLAPIA